jgi:type I restriction enzyme S subunit
LATSEFVVHLLANLARRGGLVDHISTATIAHLTGKRLKSMRVIAPPLRLQKRFDAAVGQVATLRARNVTGRVHMEALFASLQQRAFRGEL